MTAASVEVSVDERDGVERRDPDRRSRWRARARPVTVTAALNGGTRGEATPVAVTVDSGTATSRTSRNRRSRSPPIPGRTRASPTRDTVDEPDETASVTGTTTVTSFSVTGTELEITDDEAADGDVTLSDASIGEDGGSTTVTTSLSHSSSVATTVTVSVNPDAPAVTGDYSVSANKALTTRSGTTASTGTVTIAGVNNDIDAADKTVRLEGAAVNSLGVPVPPKCRLKTTTRAA